jgi:hypothetical protein
MENITAKGEAQIIVDLLGIVSSSSGDINAIVLATLNDATTLNCLHVQINCVVVRIEL